MNHTKEPWHVTQNPEWGNANYRISNKKNDNWAAFGQIAYANEANAKRIVACVNACAGMKNPVEDIAELKKQLAWHDATKEKPEERLLVIVRTKSKFYEPHFNRDFWGVTISNVQNGVWKGIDQGYEVMEWLPIPREATDD